MGCVVVCVGAVLQRRGGGVAAAWSGVGAAGLSRPGEGIAAAWDWPCCSVGPALGRC